MAIATVLKKAIPHVVQANNYLNKENSVDIVGCFAVVLLCTGP